MSERPDRFAEYRERIRSGVNTHLEKGEKLEAVVQVQKRAVWALPVGIVAALLASLSLESGSGIVRGLVIGLVIAFVIISGTTFYVLGRTNKGELVLAETAKLNQSNIKGIVDRFPLNDLITRKSGVLTERVMIDGNRYLVNRQFRPHLDEVLSR